MCQLLNLEDTDCEPRKALGISNIKGLQCAVYISAENDPNSFWKVLKTMDDEMPNNATSNTISEEQWLSHFQTLHSKHSLNVIMSRNTMS